MSIYPFLSVSQQRVVLKCQDGVCNGKKPPLKISKAHVVSKHWHTYLTHQSHLSSQVETSHKGVSDSRKCSCHAESNYCRVITAVITL